MRERASAWMCVALSIALLVGCSNGLSSEDDNVPHEPETTPIEAPEPPAYDSFSEGNDVDFSDGIIAFDADGDGVAEQYALEFIDNGDEAPSVITVTSLDDAGVATVIDSAYEVRDVMLVGNSDGSESAYVRYATGDFYSHDDDAWCSVEMRDGELVVGEPEFGC